MSEEPAPEFVLVRDHGIPKRIRSPQQSKYPFASMHIGDAIKGSEKVIKAAGLAARKYSHKHPETKFSSFKLEEGAHVLVRIS
jgi:hypothetical protein